MIENIVGNGNVAYVASPVVIGRGEGLRNDFSVVRTNAVEHRPTLEYHAVTPQIRCHKLKIKRF